MATDHRDGARIDFRTLGRGVAASLLAGDIVGRLSRRHRPDFQAVSLGKDSARRWREPPDRIAEILMPRFASRQVCAQHVCVRHIALEF